MWNQPENCHWIEIWTFQMGDGKILYYINNNNKSMSPDFLLK